MVSPHPRFLHGRALGAAIGAIVCLAAALVVNHTVAGNSDIISPPAMIVTGIFAGTMAGLLFSSIVIGGREDDEATREAHDVVAHAHPTAERGAWK
jgi:hypothetical protein